MTSKEHRADVVIVGAGVVGSAIARHLACERKIQNVVVCDALPGPGQATTAKNSHVLHSGVHQNPDFLKSRLSLRGSKMAAAYAKEKSVPIMKTGLLVAVSWQAVRSGLYREVGSLVHLLRNARRSDIAVQPKGPFAIRKLVPGIHGLGGLFIPETWVIDVAAYVNALVADAASAGAQFVYNASVQDIQRTKTGYMVTAGKHTITANAVINSAGLYADDVAKMAGFNNYTIYPWRGEYFEVLGEKRNLTKRLVYPAMPADSPTKGVHFSPRTNGKLFIGPNAKPVPSKEYYEKDKTPKEEFLQMARQFFPGLTAEDLRWAYSGIRPKISNVPQENDFLVKLDSASPPFINLIGIESPGLASSMALAEYVGDMLVGNLR